jgi:xanthine dehydrogenase iron-sulfur cluster and FAD-binding subunit A
MNSPASSIKGNSEAIRFVLDGRVIELENVDPTRTVLQFLREDLGRTGTKEGCAEGDCGACTVVLAERHADGDEIRLRAINSCIQFLPTLDGKELITVESLAEDGQLHPVQQAMVDSHASQCGFCRYRRCAGGQPVSVHGLPADHRGGATDVRGRASRSAPARCRPVASDLAGAKPARFGSRPRVSCATVDG